MVERNFSRVYGAHGRSQGSKKSLQNFDWRSSLHSVFVENLSSRISRGALWEAFNTYGRVVDVFIPKSFPGRDRSFTFAFVRFKLESEAMKAIKEGNKRMMGGRIIGVSKAFRKRTKRQKFSTIRGAPSSNIGEQFKGKPCGIVQEGKSFKDALVGATLFFGNHENSVSGGDNIVASDDSLFDEIVNVRAKEVTFDIEVPKVEMDWLTRSVVCKLRGSTSFLEVRDDFAKRSIKCLVTPMGGSNILLTFKVLTEMEVFLKEDKEFSEAWFVHCLPWNNSFVQYIYELGVVHQSDEDTQFRRRFDVARVLVSVESKLNIPSILSVNVRGKIHKVIVSIEEHFDAHFMKDSSVGNSSKSASEFSCEGIKLNHGEMETNREMEVEKSNLVADSDCWLALRSTTPSNSWGTFLLEEEMASDDGLFQETIDVDAGAIRPEAIGGNADEEVEFENEGNRVCGLITLEPHLEKPKDPDFCGPLVVYNDGSLMGSVGDLFNKNDGPPMGKKPTKSARKNKKGRKKYIRAMSSSIKLNLNHPDRKTYSRVKHRRQLRREVKELLDGVGVLELDNSGISASDNGIRNRNDLFWKEAEESWKISEALGIQFAKCKEQIVGVMAQLEEEDRCNL
ncbi:hypothetical protein REPUB_Repub06bG0062500 [Reevesia pubescens]